MAITPVVLPSALPSDLLSYVVSHCAHPTTIIICSSRLDFLHGLVGDVKQRLETVGQRQQGHADEAQQDTQFHQTDTDPAASSRLLHAPLYQVAVARHIRMVFIPTVSHLRAVLSVFSPEESKIPAPPGESPATSLYPAGQRPPPKPPLLLVYGFLQLHRGTSEWSAQGLSSSAAGLVEAADRVAFQAVIIEAKDRDAEDDFTDAIPVLSASARRMATDAEESRWTSRTVQVRRVLRRWFEFEDGEWMSAEPERERLPDEREVLADCRPSET